MGEFRLTLLQERWLSKPHQHVPRSVLRKLLIEQKGLCALSQAPLIFDLNERTPQKGGRGCHPLSPAVDHKDPGNPDGGVQIICYDLNDLKGHLPVDLFDDLCSTESWKKLMLKWREQAEIDPSDREAFKRLLRPNAKVRKLQSVASPIQDTDSSTVRFHRVLS